MRMKNLQKDKHIYFGPYTDTYYLREVLSSIHKIFPLRTCSFDINNESIKEKKHSVCLDYHIKRCEGPCEGLVPQKEYSQMIEKIKLFLRGRSGDVRFGIKEKMREASEQMRYEDAARFRDQLSAIDSFISKQKKLSHDFMDRDLISIAAEGSSAVCILIRIRNGHLVGRNRFAINIADESDYAGNIQSFILQHYSSTMDYPKEILLEVDVKDRENLEVWLSGNKKANLKILNPQRGEKRELVKMCRKNADLHLKEIIAKKIKRKEVISKTVESLQGDLDMQAPPRRIEAFDNSNIQGKHAVAGMVCFVDGKPRKGEYRKFNIKTVKGIDDFATMHEVVTRKYKRALNEGGSLPDLILIDGGKGQLSAAKSALDGLGLGYIPIIGLAKRLEEVFKPGISQAQSIAKASPGLFLLRKIRDEVHRFAISFHRKKRDKKMILSIFDGIRGMGRTRVKRLWSEFDSLKDIQKASPKQLVSALKIPEKLAKDIIKISKK
jgi:excinuclease ABC subunit C